MNRVYYNEFDPFAAAWLRNLIDAKLIPAGDVDERDIRMVQASDVKGYDQCHFFAGIGGWPLALALAGWSGPAWTGSCPCQPFSVAGKGKAEADERHLWPEFLRLIRECNPASLFGEQVASARGRKWLAGVRVDLEAMGYRVGAADLCAAGVAAPHARQRLYWLADTGGSQREEFSRRRQSEVPAQAGRSSCGGAIDGMADSNGERLKIRQEQDGAAHESEQQSPRRPDVGRRRWLGSPSQPGLEGHSGDGDRGNQSRRDGAQPAGSTSATGPSAIGMDDAASQRADKRTAAEQSGDEPQDRVSRPPSPWGDYRIIPCGDKLKRVPVESSLFPLAPRVPGRVGLLRGAGGSIVPALAAEFVKAYMDVVFDS